MLVKYKTDDVIFVRGTIDYTIIIRGKVYYKIRECDELIPEDKIFARLPEGAEFNWEQKRTNKRKSI